MRIISNRLKPSISIVDFQVIDFGEIDQKTNPNFSKTKELEILNDDSHQPKCKSTIWRGGGNPKMLKTDELFLRHTPEVRP